MQLEKAEKFKDAIKVIVKTLDIDQDVSSDPETIAQYLLNNIYALEIYSRNNNQHTSNTSN